ncbi:hypothetical protein B0I35DRAFT_424977 [Stachybotrys elegans]|uniref:SRR1-like domain-containing protein n=1 Tax=Stachybotrys elegans TaxID=80388 RepID=A0A8K0T290_9HYPO|nr:hypothetical protein B0I35DRAFT_424977 [Stachybotrys elegans]
MDDSNSISMGHVDQTGGNEPAQSPEDRTITEEGRRAAQYIRDLYESGAKLWTKESLREIEDILEAGQPSRELKLRHMDGQQRETWVPPLDRIMNNQRTRRPEDELLLQGSLRAHFVCYRQMLYDAEGYDGSDGYYDRKHEVENGRYGRFLRSLEVVASTWSCQPGTGPSVQALTEEWEGVRALWLSSSACADLLTIFSHHKDLPKITKVVCFGLGCLSSPMDPDEKEVDYKRHMRRRMTQHAAALSVAAKVGELLGVDDIAVLAQDPAYTDDDRQFLDEIGIQVVGMHGAMGFVHVDDQSIVMSCSPDICVKQVIADIARPAAVIWNRVTTEEEDEFEWSTVVEPDGQEISVSPWTTDDDSPRTRKMIESYTRYTFVKDDANFTDIEVGIRKD